MYTKALADFTANLTYEKLTPFSVEMVKRCILDWLGVCVGGSQTKPAVILRNVLPKGNCKEATVFAGAEQKASVYEAAMLNASASHCLDFDDLHNPSIIHLACVVVPGALAIAEKEGKSGKELLAAVCAGYEAGARVGESVIPESYFFWHTTGTAGIFGTAAAAANILGLDSQQTVMCYGSAGTQAAGLWEFLKEGAMSKALHAGKSTYGGVLSAYLSQAGFTAASKILEGEKGFCRAMVAEPHLEKLTEGLDYSSLKIDNNSFKPYPCCKHSHAALYAIQELCRENQIKPAAVAAVKIYINNITDYLINNPHPQTPYGCKFSLQYCAAAMLQTGKVVVGSFADDVINNTDIRSVMERVSVIKDAEQEAVHAQDPSKLASKVTIELVDGQAYSMQVDYPKGDPQNMLTWDETVGKFMSLAVPVYGERKAAKLCALVRNLDECSSVTQGIKEALEV